jgi:uncharacterized membrane protein YdbT with pleckstrin-like domain
MSSHPLTDPEERVVLDTPPHILFLILPIFAVVVIWFIYILVVCPSIILLLDDGCLLISTLTFLFLILVLFLDWINNRLILTNLTVTRQRGIIGKTIMEIRLDRIQDVKISFGIIGKIFRFGTLKIESAGTFGKITFRGIPAPLTIKNQVEKEIQNLLSEKHSSI